MTFARPVPPRAVGELARLPGVITAEGVRAVPVRVRNGHRMRESRADGATPPTRRSAAWWQRSGRVVPVPEDGVVITDALGEMLGVRRRRPI